MDQIARNQKQLAAAIRRGRRQSGLTQAVLGSRIHKRQATISNLESAGGGTTLETLFAILSALDLELVVRPRTKSSSAQLEDQF
jgi:HTH-type transcriptional regulator/antitoxin HipB